MREGLDLIAYVALSAFPISFFTLSTYGTAQFSYTIAFAIMFTVSILALLFIKFYIPDVGEGEDSTVADFDENLRGYSLLVSVLVAAATLAMVSLLIRIPEQTVLFIPKPDVALPFSVAAVTSETVGNVLYQFTLVAPAEESLKVAGIYALWSRFAGWEYGEAPAVAVPVGLWAAFHTILAGFTPWMVIIAFAAGIIFYAGMRLTGSILTAILAHAIYNSSIILLGG